MAECEISCLEKRISKMEETFHLKSEELAKRNEDLLAMSKEAQMLNKRLLLQKKENDTLRQQLTEKDNLSGLQKEIAREEEHLRNLQSDIDSRKKQVMTLRAKLETTTGTDIMLELHAKSNAAKPEPMDETDALLLENHFFTTDKHFYEKIMSYKQQMSKLEWILCQLVRANFKNAEISRLTAKNPSTISNLKRRTFEKIFHKESNSTTEFDQWILS